MSDEEVIPLHPANGSERPSGWTFSLVRAAIACVIGSSFQVGYNTGVLNAPEKSFKDFYNGTYISRTGNSSISFPKTELTYVWSLTVSMFCIGGMVGGLSGGILASKIGRKKLMLLNNITLVVACLLMFSCILADSYEIVIAGRFLVGVHSGVSTVVAPLYLSEVAPLPLKGAFGTMNQLAIVTGVVVSQALGLTQILGGEYDFFYLLLVPLGPALLQIVLFAFSPESPAWLRVYRNDPSATRRALMSLRNSADIDDEMASLASVVADVGSAEKKVTPMDFLTVRHLRVPLIIAVCMQLSQQLSGINAVTYYSTSIFQSVGLDAESAQYATLGLGGVMVVMTFISVLLIDRLGRRVLHLAGLCGMLLSLPVLTVALKLAATVWWIRFLGIAALVMYIVFFNIGPGAIPWFITAELFEHDARTHAVAIANFVNWLANFSVGVLFPIMQSELKDYQFLPFIALLFFFCIFTYLMVPETKNRPTDVVVAQFKLR